VTLEATINKYLVNKANPYHAKDGKFTTKQGGAGGGAGRKAKQTAGTKEVREGAKLAPPSGKAAYMGLVRNHGPKAAATYARARKSGYSHKDSLGIAGSSARRQAGRRSEGAKKAAATRKAKTAASKKGDIDTNDKAFKEAERAYGGNPSHMAPVLQRRFPGITAQKISRAMDARDGTTPAPYKSPLSGKRNKPVPAKAKKAAGRARATAYSDARLSAIPSKKDAYTVKSGGKPIGSVYVPASGRGWVGIQSRDNNKHAGVGPAEATFRTRAAAKKFITENDLTGSV
jgi:hypothetical protein